MSDHNVGAPYEPRVTYMCNDRECCRNGCPVVTCIVCGEAWPCPDYREAHTRSQVERQERWVGNVWGDGT